MHPHGGFWGFWPKFGILPKKCTSKNSAKHYFSQKNGKNSPFLPQPLPPLFGPKAPKWPKSPKKWGWRLGQDSPKKGKSYPRPHPHLFGPKSPFLGLWPKSRGGDWGKNPKNPQNKMTPGKPMAFSRFFIGQKTPKKKISKKDPEKTPGRGGLFGPKPPKTPNTPSVQDFSRKILPARGFWPLPRKSPREAGVLGFLVQIGPVVAFSTKNPKAPKNPGAILRFWGFLAKNPQKARASLGSGFLGVFG